MIYNFVGIILGLAALASSKVYFKEEFNDAEWKDRWVVPTKWKSKSDLGRWEWTTGKWYGDETDKGIQSTVDARFHGISAKMDEAFTNKDKPLVLQFSVKYEQDIDCGGAYIKLLGDMDQDKFGGDTPYQIMFGPDVCGTSNRKTHVIFNYPPKDENLLIKNEVKCETDRVTHVYTLVVKPDKTFEVFIDLKSVREGALEEEFDFLLPKTIKDPSVSKPKDWVDIKKIPDPEDIKPEGYDDIPSEIPDPDATKPEDWDDEEDGEWEAPMISNPKFKGEWKPKMIDNPEYKGEWKHPEIPNPDYAEDKDLSVRCKDCTHVGFELWQVKAGTIFDSIIVTDSFDEAKEFAQATWGKTKTAEKAMYDKYEEEKAAREKADLEKTSPNVDAEDEEEEELDHDEL
mmetsp:Transcript_18832/g.18948  ORF Transcript_18832/g.18948 Transcript_18832/m.18948 type:complete len:400 (+) Transcript_18832:85-1284(+)|eukprot:CAMPEP_0182427538 /NCGR_PEP_ID=MMETSP1167-20130531/18231_1 /TAXON_ID=2988 /ORGANISM="Mallomonas Sp, Strain CCMP3275" /LENGTH=399 /DNA_ID=CAMNT_0024609845 /DNA_START=85 /DNA_END=1284 /DNA_ORIENTATION=+